MSWNVTANLNPEFVRGMRVSLPRRRAVFVAALTVSILAAGGWLVWNSAAPSSYEHQLYGPLRLRAIQTREFGRTAFGALTVALFGLFFILAPATAGLSLIQERLRGTAIFQQMSMLSPLKLAAGKFFGSGLLAYFIAAMLLPCALFAASLSDVPPGKVLRIYLLLFVGGLCWQAIGVYVSATLAAPAEKGLRGGLLVGPLVGLGGAVAALGLSQYFIYDAHTVGLTEYYRDYYTWHFYGAEVPAYTVVLGLLAFAGAWAFVGGVRRIKTWQLIPTAPHAVWLFFASAEALLVGLLWGRHAGDSLPQARLVTYMLLNWIVLAAIAGGAALGRGNLREWWSAERDPVAVFQRGEIKNTLKTFLVALGISSGGLVALWTSYHFNPDGTFGGFNLAQLLPVLFCFAATMLGMAAFVQFTGMHRFRIGGWAGVVLLAVFYLFVGVAGALFDNKDNVAALANPLVYAEATTKGDFHMDRRFVTEIWPDAATDESHYKLRVVRQLNYEPNPAPLYNVQSARTLGLLVEGALAALCFGLAYMKWTRTREEMLHEGGSPTA